MPYVNNKGTDQPDHSCSLISSFVVRCLSSIINILAKSKISRLQLVSEAEQTSLSLTWFKTLKTVFLMTWLKSESSETFYIVIFHFCFILPVATNIRVPS